jgi:hypothetical protein
MIEEAQSVIPIEYGPATAALARKLLDYNPETGHFIWSGRGFFQRNAGGVAGSVVGGYIRIKLADAVEA